MGERRVLNEKLDAKLLPEALQFGSPEDKPAEVFDCQPASEDQAEPVQDHGNKDDCQLLSARGNFKTSLEVNKGHPNTKPVEIKGNHDDLTSVAASEEHGTPKDCKLDGTIEHKCDDDSKSVCGHDSCDVYDFKSDESLAQYDDTEKIRDDHDYNATLGSENCEQVDELLKPSTSKEIKSVLTDGKKGNCDMLRGAFGCINTKPVENIRIGGEGVKELNFIEVSDDELRQFERMGNQNDFNASTPFHVQLEYDIAKLVVAYCRDRNSDDSQPLNKIRALRNPFQEIDMGNDHEANPFQEFEYCDDEKDPVTPNGFGALVDYNKMLNPCQVVSMQATFENPNLMEEVGYRQNNIVSAITNINTLIQNIRERDYFSEVTFPFLWDSNGLCRMPKFEVKSSDATIGNELSTQTIYSLASKEESLSITINLVKCTEIVPSIQGADTTLDLPMTQEPIPLQTVCATNTSTADDKHNVSIHDLPNEILHYIFSFLNVKERIRIESVCKLWQSIGKNVQWGNAAKLFFVYFPKADSLEIPADVIVDALEAVLSRCGQSLEEVLLSIHYFNDNANNTSSKLSDALVRYCPKLTRMDLSFQVTNASLKIIANGCPNLKWLCVKCFKANVNVGIMSVVKQCKKLERLAIADLPRTGNWFDFLNPKLRCLCLSCCTLLPRTFQKLIRRCHAIEELCISSCTPIRGSELFQVCGHFLETLKVLRIHCTLELELFNWCEGFKNFQSLQELSMSDCQHVNDHTMATLAENCLNLRELCISLTSVSDAGLISLKVLPCLKVLDVSMNSILGHGLAELATVGLLEKVYLDAVFSLKDNACCPFAFFCPNFSLLDATNTKITNNLVKEFCWCKSCGLLKSPVTLHVGKTGVTENVETCAEVEVVFDVLQRSWMTLP